MNVALPIPAAILGDFAALHRAPEADVLARLVPDATVGPAVRDRVLARGAGLLADLRAAQHDGWVNRFLQQYRLNTEEGVALLTLAEAFLRVPDAETADALIRDKIGDGDWAAHLGASDSGLVNGATWGLVMTRALVSGDGPLRRLVARAGEPFVRQAVGAAMRVMASIFVMGRDAPEALARMERPEFRAFDASFDMLGEAARTFPDADRYMAAYEAAVDAVGATPGTRHSVSVKLSALHPRYETAHAAACVPALTERLVALATRARDRGVALTVDAEEQDRLLMSLDIVGAAARALPGWDGLGLAVQAYGKRARPLIDWAADLAAETGRRIGIRLVKGAYWDSEVKRTQEAGLSDYPLFTRKAATDVSYLACARAMLGSDRIFAAFASHNALTVATVLEWAGDRRDFEFQRLHGMGQGLYERLVAQGYRCRLYAPVGGHRDLLAYLVRRLLENGANSSFVHQLADARVDDAALLADPVEKVRAVGGAPHPAIPLPQALFPGRRNSAGLDLADAAILADVAGAVAGRTLEPVPDAIPADVAAAVARAEAAFPAWDATPVEERARALEAWADRLEADRDALLRLLVQEAGKTIGDAFADLREAVDFCRYYAIEARRVFAPVSLPGPTGEANSLQLAGRGPWACIAPWNFPLAIFVGQCAAALAAGNAVLAKPAPQTPRIALRAVAHARAAGVPEGAIACLPGGGDVGEALVRDPRVMGVAFTGSTATAKRIQRALADDDARPIIPLIAETGGINAMIVDSTALPEQVVADVVASAFRSAGQRCSALRVLLLQDEIADNVIAMLRGAMDTLVVGDPANPATDVGPVIDRAARDHLMAYRESVRPRWLHTVPAPADGHFVPPTMIAADDVAHVNREWFGPLLHVARWRAGELDALLTRIAASGYGLTMGLHSRIAAVADRVRDRAAVGNLYVNRSMIGAVVGAQPFGGEGLSGTGPKAGGPNYLPRFALERAVSIDTTSAGGNAALLAVDG